MSHNQIKFMDRLNPGGPKLTKNDLKKKRADDTPEVIVKRALWLAHYSHIIYDYHNVVAIELDKQGLVEDTSLNFYDHQGIQAIVHYVKEKYVIVAIRGTDGELADIVADIGVFPRKFKEGKFKAHGGFVKRLNAIWGSARPKLSITRPSIFYQPNTISDVLFREYNNKNEMVSFWKGKEFFNEKDELIRGISDVLTRVEEENIPIYFTGHSYGGALATIAAYRALNLGLKNEIHLYTYGSPRVLRSDFAAEFDAIIANSYRFVNRMCIVSRVPPAVFGYNHIGRYIYLDKSGRFNQKTPVFMQFLMNNFVLFSFALQLAVFPLFILFSVLNIDIKMPGVKDHGIEEYITNLDKALSRME